MRKILVIGSGKSASYLIKYLLEKSISEKLHIIVGDINVVNAEKLIGSHQNAEAIVLDVFDQESVFVSSFITERTIPVLGSATFNSAIL